MSKHGPIYLWARREFVDPSDATISHIQHPPSYIPGTYTNTRDLGKDSRIYRYVPPLAFLCLQKLYVFCDQLQAIGVPRISWPEAEGRETFDMLGALTGQDDHENLETLDPRLWATLIQIYNGLPPILDRLRLPLSDEYLPLLSSIAPTNDISLITLLELPGCRELTDDTIIELRYLHNLFALDVSVTSVSSYGIRRFALCRPPPSQLRILRLRRCVGIDDDIYSHLGGFKLLTALDLRGTKCTKNSFMKETGFLSAFGSEKEPLFHPTCLRDSVKFLESFASELHSSPRVFQLYVNTLHHRKAGSFRHRPSIFGSLAYPAEGNIFSLKRQDRGHHGTPATFHPDHKFASESEAAGREAQRHKSDQHTAKFYSQHLGRDSAGTGPFTAGYSAESFLKNESQAGPFKGNDDRMFYRTAPPWPKSLNSNVSSISPLEGRSRESSTKRATEGLLDLEVKIKRTPFSKGGVQEIQQALLAKRSQPELTGFFLSDPSNNCLPTPSKGRKQNPFKNSLEPVTLSKKTSKAALASDASSNSSFPEHSSPSAHSKKRVRLAPNESESGKDALRLKTNTESQKGSVKAGTEKLEKTKNIGTDSTSNKERSKQKNGTFSGRTTTASKLDWSAWSRPKE